MILRDNLFYIRSNETTAKGSLFHLELNPNHFIYQAHFPSQPITPGVCIVQIVKELLEIETNRKLAIKKVNNVKFLSIISPADNCHISCELIKIQVDEESRQIKTQAVIFSDKETYAKVSFICDIL